MKVYEQVYEDLELSPRVIDCALGKITSPIASLESPAHWYGYPPALVPIWSDGARPTYIGVWKHWFFERPKSFVKMYVGLDRLTVEIARNSDQLLWIIGMMSISINDGIELMLERFSSNVGLLDLNEIDEISLRFGDDPKGFVSSKLFKIDIPLESVNDYQSYNGYFPVSNVLGEIKRINKSCSFEISEDMYIKLRSINSEIPSWLREGNDQKNNFSRYIQDGDLASAWLTLNSRGWFIKDARSAIQDLDSLAKDEKFSRLAAAWLEVADVGAGSY